MRKLTFFPKLAFGSIVRNHRFYYPFIMACAIMAAMFYNLMFILTCDGLNSMRGGMNAKAMLTFGAVIVSIFACIFVLYTNGFLMKQRKRELGLYNILGMDKGNIRQLMLWESLYSYIASVILGLAAGVLISKLMLLLLYKLLSFDVPFGFTVSIFGMLASAALFAVIFAACFMYNMVCVARAKPVDLLHGSQVGEKEPKAKWVIFALGILTLGAGYYMAVTITSPMKALAMFFIAVVLVIIGTYCLFTSGSISVLKMMRANKKYYYKPNHFTTVSGMMYRMKQNAAGLASICILSTMVLVMISTTVCLYVGVEDQMLKTYPTDITIQLTTADEAGFPDTLNGIIRDTVASENLEMRNVTQYECLDFTVEYKGGKFSASDNHFTTGDPYVVTVITAAEYNKCFGADIAVPRGSVAVARSWDDVDIQKLEMLGMEYSVSENFEWREIWNDMPADMAEYVTVVVSDREELVNIYNMQLDAFGENYASMLSWSCFFDLNGSDKQKLACADALFPALMDEFEKSSEYSRHGWYVSSRQENIDYFYSTYGGLLFIGIFLGALFVMATALIIYYKQISEGYDDRRRFEIMQNVGMSKSEVKKSITGQILTVFFLPLGAACLHLAFAFNMIFRMLELFALDDMRLFASCTAVTILLFAACYAIIYALTARTYYKIVRT